MASDSSSSSSVRVESIDSQLSGADTYPEVSKLLKSVSVALGSPYTS
jgi:hypothetical protein